MVEGAAPNREPLQCPAWSHRLVRLAAPEDSGCQADLLDRDRARRRVSPLQESDFPAIGPPRPRSMRGSRPGSPYAPDSPPRRDGRILTCDCWSPRPVRYQAAPRLNVAPGHTPPTSRGRLVRLSWGSAARSGLRTAATPSWPAGPMPAKGRITGLFEPVRGRIERRACASRSASL